MCTLTFKKATITYIIAVFVVSVCYGLWSFKRTSSANIEAIRNAMAKIIAQQQKTIEYMESKILDYAYKQQNTKISKIIKDIEDDFYVVSTENNIILPSSIHWIYYDEPIQIIGSYGEKDKLSLSPDLDYYYACEEDNTKIQISNPYLSNKIEDLYLINVGKSVYKGDKILGFIDMSLPVKSLLTIIAANNFNTLFDYAIIDRKSNLSNSYSHKTRSFIEQTIVLQQYQLQSLIAGTELTIGINKSVYNKMLYILLNNKLLYLLVLIIYAFSVVLFRICSYIMRKQALHALLPSIYLASKKSASDLQIKNLFKEINSIIVQSFNECHNTIKKYQDQISNLKNDILALTHVKQKLNICQEKNNLLELGINTQEKYGAEAKAYVNKYFINTLYKVTAALNAVTSEPNLNFAKEKIKQLLQKISTDITAIRDLTVPNTTDNITVEALIVDVISINKSFAYHKSIKICHNYQDIAEQIVVNNAFTLTRAMAAIIYQLIYNAPHETNIFVSFNFATDDILKIIFKDNSFGYMQFDVADNNALRGNFFDMRALNWDEIKHLINIIGGDISIRSVTYEGNIVEISIPYGKKNSEQIQNLHGSNIVNFSRT